MQGNERELHFASLAKYWAALAGPRKFVIFLTGIAADAASHSQVRNSPCATFFNVVERLQ
ncbi:hypothetical protein N182_28060 [Sinorhizobium sp. GL2]|nr:hypothetical protein N182_28060 [Sinorhizobium sp. GL2]